MEQFGLSVLGHALEEVPDGADRYSTILGTPHGALAGAGLGVNPDGIGTLSSLDIWFAVDLAGRTGTKDQGCHQRRQATTSQRLVVRTGQPRAREPGTDSTTSPGEPTLTWVVSSWQHTKEKGHTTMYSSNPFRKCAWRPDQPLQRGRCNNRLDVLSFNYGSSSPRPRPSLVAVLTITPTSGTGAPRMEKAVAAGLWVVIAQSQGIKIATADFVAIGPVTVFLNTRAPDRAQGTPTSTTYLSIP
ncbi:hypothetical protein TgHK011_000536 [Trichoderma gracile]|nr:hypothetical protein TgHK011_000536 [Trichoderma gracile]